MLLLLVDIIEHHSCSLPLRQLFSIQIQMICVSLKGLKKMLSGHLGKVTMIFLPGK